ncbi:MAG: hypothetical protein JSV18_08050 [Candidatus Bathyarchaeota archaeon]|nr:MAG: hypothetical protein JSV18_08050 [Candidatus Bathyarchaeota archaeon]
MKFCERCGTFMDVSAIGYVCPKCGQEVEVESIEIRREKKESPEKVHVVDSSMSPSPKVNQQCPRCESTEAYRTVLMTQGEHAGIKQDRVVERFTCVKCNHTWVRS